MRSVLAALVAVGLLTIAPQTGATVRDVGPSGFAAGGSVDIAAPPREVWNLLLRPARWWSEDHTYFHRAAGLTLEPKAGGCWCEKAAGGREVEHMRVIYIDPSEMVLRLDGALGPLQGTGVTGRLTFTLIAHENGSRLGWTYDAGGHRAGGFAEMATAVDEVLGEQVNRLAAVGGGGGGND